MAKIKGKDTKPEMVVRRLAHGLGFRYRLHARDLPGHPDLVFPRLKRIIFVHGCFFHRHGCKRGTSTPRTNAGFWRKKLEGNQARDRRNIGTLRRRGWKVLVVWECQTGEADRLADRIRDFLTST